MERVRVFNVVVVYILWLLLPLPLLWIYMFLLVLQSGLSGQMEGMRRCRKTHCFLFQWKIIIFLCVNDSIRPLCAAMILSSLQHRISMCCSCFMCIYTCIAQVEMDGKSAMAMTNPTCRKVNSNTIVKSDIHCSVCPPCDCVIYLNHSVLV